MQSYLFIAANEGNCWGGSELLWSQTAERLRQRGAAVRVSVPNWSPPAPQVLRLRDMGCQIDFRNGPSFAQRLGTRFLHSPGYIHQHLQKLAHGVQLTVISQGGNADGLPWMEACTDGGHRYAVVSQLASELFWPDDARAARLARCYSAAARAYFVSQANLDLSERQFGVKLPKARVTRNPFAVRYDARPPWPAGDPDLAFACVARLDLPHKGQDLLLQTLALPHWRSRNVRLSLVGAGPNERSLRLAASEQQLSNVIFCGELTDIEEVWSRHHALVLASRYEGLPLSLIEAMLCARPSVVTAVGGNRELVSDGVNGFLAKAPTVELLDEAMNRAWENRAHLRDMGERAASDVRKCVSADPVEDFARDLQSLLESPLPQ